MKRLTLSDENIKEIMLSLAGGEPGINEDRFDFLTAKLCDDVLGWLMDGALAHLLLEGKLYMRWNDATEDWVLSRRDLQKEKR